MELANCLRKMNNSVGGFWGPNERDKPTPRSFAVQPKPSAAGAEPQTPEQQRSPLSLLI